MKFFYHQPILKWSSAKNLIGVIDAWWDGIGPPMRKTIFRFLHPRRKLFGLVGRLKWPLFDVCEKYLHHTWTRGHHILQRPQVVIQFAQLDIIGRRKFMVNFIIMGEGEDIGKHFKTSQTLKFNEWLDQF